MKILPRRRPTAFITNDIYFEHNNGLIFNKAAIFKNLVDTSPLGYDFMFPKLKFAYFVDCDKNYTWQNVEPERMPNIRHIYLATPYDTSLIYRFDSKDVYYHISSKYFKSNEISNLKKNITVWNHYTLMSYIEHLPTQKINIS